MSLELLGAEEIGVSWAEAAKNWGVVHETLMPVMQQIPIASAFVPLADFAYTEATGQPAGPRGAPGKPAGGAKAPGAPGSPAAPGGGLTGPVAPAPPVLPPAARPGWAGWPAWKKAAAIGGGAAGIGILGLGVALLVRR